jgi:hypothetical protein
MSGLEPLACLALAASLTTAVVPPFDVVPGVMGLVY